MTMDLISLTPAIIIWTVILILSGLLLYKEHKNKK